MHITSGDYKLTSNSWEGEQCVGQTGSIPRLGFRSLCLQDSPVGVRDTDYNSVFSSGQTVAATFDRGLMYARGYAMGQEHKGKGVTVQLGPVAGPIGKAPEGGRNWEGFSPDPVLTGIGIAQTISGIQNHVVACAKHFIGKYVCSRSLLSDATFWPCFIVIVIVVWRWLCDLGIS